jgi:membrane protease YdiL (CAAX protease family)
MSAPGVWAGLSDSVFLTGVDDRERDPARLATTVLGGAALGLVAAICLLLLVMVVYTLMAGDGARGLAGLGDALATISDPRASGPWVVVLRLVVAVAVDGAFLVVFVAFAALLLHRPLTLYVTAAPRVRWRLLAVGMALSAAAIAPIVVVERLLATGAAAPPIFGVSALAGDRLAYLISSVLLIPAAAAEELFFRGWLLRQTAAFLRRPLMLVGLTALSFSALHFDFSPDAFLTRALMGAGFAYMTLRLGGIELSTAAHSVNNLMIVLFLQPISVDQGPAVDVSAHSLLEDLALVGGYVLITELVARSGTLRRLAGVQGAEVSPERDVSAHFG